MWISKRCVQKSSHILTLNRVKTNQNRRILMKTTTKQHKKTGLAMLQNGFWIRKQLFSNYSAGIIENIQSAVKYSQELLEIHNKKMKSAQQMSAYVSSMQDYFTSDNLWKIVIKKVNKMFVLNYIMHFQGTEL
jgi:hypothetical protein